MQLYKKKVIFYFFIFPISENIVFYRRGNTPLMTVAHPTGCFPPLFFSNGTLTLFRNLCMSMCPGGKVGLGPSLLLSESSIPTRWLVSVWAWNLVLAHESFGQRVSLWEDLAHRGPHSSHLAGPKWAPVVTGRMKEYKGGGTLCPCLAWLGLSFLGISCYVKVGSGFSLLFRQRHLADYLPFRSQLRLSNLSLLAWNLSQTCYIVW